MSVHVISAELPQAVRTALRQTAVVIPARNEEQSISLVLSDLPEVACVIVANNGSTDATAAIADAAGCTVVDEPCPGYGRACLAGLSRLAAIAEQFDPPITYVAFIDADYSDHPEELVQLLQVMCDEEADFVLGSRMRGKRQRGSMPLQATMGNRLACFLMRLVWRAHYSDLGPFRVIRYVRLHELQMQDQDFGWTIEMQIKAKIAGLKTLEVPVSYRRRVGVSKISGTVSGTILAGYKILYTIAKYAVGRRDLTGKPRAQTSHAHAHEPV